jgi:hypothetical protein
MSKEKGMKNCVLNVKNREKKQDYPMKNLSFQSCRNKTNF